MSWPARLGSALRILLYGSFGTLLLLSFWQVEGDVPASHRRLVFVAVFLPWLALCSLVRAFSPGGLWRRRRIAMVDLAAINFITSFYLVEGVLALLSCFIDSPLLWDRGTPERTIATFHQKPGGYYFNHRLNKGGYNDEEFFVRGDKDRVAVLIGDSYAFSILPYAYGFPEVAQRAIQREHPDFPGRIAIHNIGIPGIGPAEYAWLLDHEAFAWKPDYVVLSIFVGNDIEGLMNGEGTRVRLQDFLVWKVMKRLVRLARAKQEGNVLTQCLTTDAPTPLPEDMFDYRKEKATLEPKIFEEIETVRIAFCDAEDRKIGRSYDAFFRAMDYFRSRLGDRLLVILHPDELQIDDGLYRRISARYGHCERLVRDYPQQRIVGYCRQHDVSCLDLMPQVLEAAKKEPPYYVRNTHYNRWGNEVVGRALASFLAEKFFPAGKTAEGEKETGK